MKIDDPMFDALYQYTKALSVALGYRDPLTRLHSERVQVLSVEIAYSCNLPSEMIHILKIAASFHDIGKIGIPDNVLLKPSSFDALEWQVMQKHPIIGEQIMLATELDGAKQAATLIRHHHEQVDGLGYPDKLAGDNIPLCSRIISIADSYDAMAVARPYHTPKSHSEIMDILYSETNKKYDPDLMNIFSQVIEKNKYKSLI
ncbi:HD domain-containing phosphohydrolase [uncultured Tolumonas sp.]|uniref:HD-GYP domain-containing protein n=1 Tax=uncultured Tolumonas sp. TaxID=263765 RepID=UPI002A0A9E33|nr:HD domain-containing phosphohydrolase [uncultured Tolumonas sp.]